MGYLCCYCCCPCYFNIIIIVFNGLGPCGFFPVFFLIYFEVVVLFCFFVFFLLFFWGGVRGFF